MNDAEKLAQLFEKFPGIGPRQARRFVYFLLKSGGTYRGNLVQSIQNLAQNIHECSKCQRYYSGENDTICTICINDIRDNRQLLIVEKDADLDQIEKNSIYSGHYFVLGERVRLTKTIISQRNTNKLKEILKKTQGLEEIILAFPTTKEGEHTEQTVQYALKELLSEDILNMQKVKITVLGRGLSTGAELEYADGATLKSALEGRN